MTCREKLKLEHPDFVHMKYDAGCKGCPSDYGYTHDNRCYLGCDDCWDQEVETETKQNKTSQIDIHKIIDDVMEKKDRSVSIYIGESGVSVTVTPLDEPVHWETGLKFNGNYRCSNCRAYEKLASAHCPNCGERMHGVEEVKE